MDEAPGLPPRLAAARVARMHGRTPEVAAIEDCVGDAADGTPRLVLVSGEPGIGKTRLAAEAAALAAEAGRPVLHGGCDDRLLATHQPFAEALGGWAGALGPDRARATLGDAVAQALVPLVPALADGEGDGGAAETDRFALFGAVARALGQLGRPSALLVLDDLHWADEGTLEMLRHVLGAPTRLPVAVVALYRPTELLDDEHPLVSFAATAAERPTTRCLALGGLSVEEIAAIVAESGAGGEPDGLARWLRSETAGNPFLVRQLVRHLEERGRLAEAATGGGTPSSSLPGSVRDVALSRVRRLGRSAADVLSAGAVAGLRFDLEVAAAAAGVDAEAARGEADKARRAGIVEHDGGGWRFTHALFGHALREALPPSRRGALHRAVAEAMEGAGDAAPALVAEHWLAADPPAPDRALAWARRAGEEAHARLAPREAVRWLSLARDLLDGRGAPDAPERLDVLIALGDAQRAAGDPEFRDTLLEASRLAHAAGDTERLVRAVLHNTRGYIAAGGQVDEERVALLQAALEALGPEGDDAVRARVMTLLALERSFDGRWRERRELAAEGLELARRAGDPDTLCRVLVMRNTAIWAPDTVDARIADSREAVALAERLGDGYAQSRALVWEAMALLDAGDVPAAGAAIERASAIAEELGQPYARWQTRIMVGNLAAARGELDDAEVHANAALEIGMASGQPDVLPFYANQIAAIRWDQGRLGELQPLVAQAVAANPGVPSFRPQLALALCEADLEDEAREVLADDVAAGFAGFDYDVLWLGSMALYGEVAAHVGDASAAEALHERLAPWGGQVVNIGGTCWDTVARPLGRLDALLGRLDDAVERLEANVEHCDANGTRVWAARARLDLARALVERGAGGDAARARELLAEAAAGANRHGAAAVERRARAVLESLDALAAVPLGAPGPRAPARAGALRREGAMWRLEVEDRVLHLPDSRGLDHLARLLAAPGVEHAATALAGNGGDPERARVNVTRAVRRAIARIGAHDPALGVDLDQAVRTGAVCVYDPPPGGITDWTVETG